MEGPCGTVQPQGATAAHQCPSAVTHNTGPGRIESSTLGFQPRGSGESPTPGLHKTPWCVVISHHAANEMLAKWHYLGPVKGILFAVGHSEGCCVFTNCRSRIYEKKNLGVVELARMVGAPGHQWAMSSLMSQAMRECRRRGYKRAITYADPWNGNTGQVYLAAGWTRVGQSQKDTVYILDGKRIARRTLYDKHGTQSKPILKGVYGERLRFEAALPKPIFVRDL